MVFNARDLAFYANFGDKVESPPKNLRELPRALFRELSRAQKSALESFLRRKKVPYVAFSGTKKWPRELFQARKNAVKSSHTSALP